jgi:hypothetical protein
MTTYLRTSHTETRTARSGNLRSQRLDTEWHIEGITPSSACEWIAQEGGRNIRVLPPFRDNRFC